MTTLPRRTLLLAAAGGLAAAGVLGALATPAGATRKAPTLQAEKITKYGEVLANSKGYSLYVLDAKGKPVACPTSNQCAIYWPPLEVAAGSKITTGAGLKGKVGHQVVGKKWLVTYNGWPVYGYTGDTGPKQSHGEGLTSFGGTWYLLAPGAKTAAATPIK